MSEVPGVVIGSFRTTRPALSNSQASSGIGALLRAKQQLDGHHGVGVCAVEHGVRYTERATFLAVVLERQVGDALLHHPGEHQLDEAAGLTAGADGREFGLQELGRARPAHHLDLSIHLAAGRHEGEGGVGGDLPIVKRTPSRRRSPSASATEGRSATRWEVTSTRVKRSARPFRVSESGSSGASNSSTVSVSGAMRTSGRGAEALSGSTTLRARSARPGAGMGWAATALPIRHSRHTASRAGVVPT
jgi:hypothetical protein